MGKGGGRTREGEEKGRVRKKGRKEKKGEERGRKKREKKGG